LTAWRWCRDDKMPCAWTRTPTGTILVQPQVLDISLRTYTYCRVSSYNKKDDLARQVARCADFCSANGWSVNRQFKEVASGMNDSRKQLLKLFEQLPGRLIVEHKDRLTRFGFCYIETLLTKLGWELVVINRDTDDKADLMTDLISIITSFCCRLYGLRRGQRKAKDIREQCEEPAK